MTELRDSIAAAAETDSEREAALAAFDKWALEARVVPRREDLSDVDFAKEVTAIKANVPAGTWCEARPGVRLLPTTAAALLHESLRAHAASVCNDTVPSIDQMSWLRRWWDYHSYLAFREPLPLNVSYWFLLSSPTIVSRGPAPQAIPLLPPVDRLNNEHSPIRSLGETGGGELAALSAAWTSLAPLERQCCRAASLACCFLEQRDRLLAGTFPEEARRRRSKGAGGGAEAAKGRRAPESDSGPANVEGRLCPAGWGWLFHCLRLPMSGSDAVERHWEVLTAASAETPAELPEWANTLAVLRRGTVWIVRVPTEAAGRYAAAPLARCLERVAVAADAVAAEAVTGAGLPGGFAGVGLGLGAATAQHREGWAGQFDALTASWQSPFRAAVGDIARAAMVVSLDPRGGSGGVSDTASLSAMLLHSDVPPASATAAATAATAATISAAAAAASPVSSAAPLSPQNSPRDASTAATGACDRWFDKPLQLVCFGGASSGSAGIVAEHSMVDGMPVASLTVAACAREPAVTAEVLREWFGSAKSGQSLAGDERMALPLGSTASLPRTVDDVPASQPSAGTAALPPPAASRFQLAPTAAEVAAARGAVAGGVASLRRLSAEHVCRAVAVPDIGSDDVKRIARCPPDAFAQMCWQLAWCIAHLAASDDGDDGPPPHPSLWLPARREPRSADEAAAAPDAAAGSASAPFPLAGQYEPAHARSFRGGRTACVRGLTRQSREWVAAAVESLTARLVADPGSAGSGGGAPPRSPAQALYVGAKTRDGLARRALEALRAACARHRVATTRAMQGRDVDRPALGMRLVLGRARQSPRRSLLAWPRGSIERDGPLQRHSAAPGTAPALPADGSPVQSGAAVSDAMRALAGTGAPWRELQGQEWPPRAAKPGLGRASCGRSAMLASAPPYETLGPAIGTAAVAAVGRLTDEAFGSAAAKRSMTWRISTSNLGATCIANWGWGQVVPNGVGVAYSIKPTSFTVNVVGRVDAKCVLRSTKPALAAAPRLDRDWESTVQALRSAFLQASGRGRSSSLADAFAWAVPVGFRLAMAIARAGCASHTRDSKL